MPKLEVKIYKYGTVFLFLPNTWRCRIFRIITVIALLSVKYGGRDADVMNHKLGMERQRYFHKPANCENNS